MQSCGSFCDKWSFGKSFLRSSNPGAARLPPVRGTVFCIPHPSSYPLREDLPEKEQLEDDLPQHGENSGNGNNAQQVPTALPAFGEAAVNSGKPSRPLWVQNSHSSGDRQKNTQRTDLKEKMFPNCDFSATDRLALLQKATRLTLNSSW